MARPCLLLRRHGLQRRQLRHRRPRQRAARLASAARPHAALTERLARLRRALHLTQDHLSLPARRAHAVLLFLAALLLQLPLRHAAQRARL